MIIAYACENKGSEPGVGYQWAKAILELCANEEVILITRKNNDVGELKDYQNLKIVGLDLPPSILKLKKYAGIRLYYLIWTFCVFGFLLYKYPKIKNAILHHITFTPVYYPPVYMVLPYKFIWGPVGGGETYPMAYLLQMRRLDALKEILRFMQVFSVYINPIFYLACLHSKKIISSTEETAAIFPSRYKHKIFIELMVVDDDKPVKLTKPELSIVIANRLIHWKMTHLFVDAFAKFQAKSGSDYKLYVVGNGRYLKEIQRFCNSENITHITAFDDRADMFKLLSRSSLFVSMSLRDSGAASLLEAASFNIPFLVSNSGAHKDFLNKGVGFGLNLQNYQTDVENLIKLLEKILVDPNVLEDEKYKLGIIYETYYSRKAKLSRIQKMLINEK